MSHWALPYLGDPWHPHRHDCWVFVRRVQRDRFSRDLPAIDPDNYRAETKAALFASHPHRHAWQEVPREAVQEGDCVRMANASNPGHVGVWIDVDGGRVLHCDDPMGVMATPLASLADLYTDIRFYRFVGEKCQP